MKFFYKKNLIIFGSFALFVAVNIWFFGINVAPAKASPYDCPLDDGYYAVGSFESYRECLEEPFIDYVLKPARTSPYRCNCSSPWHGVVSERDLAAEDPFIYEVGETEYEYRDYILEDGSCSSYEVIPELGYTDVVNVLRRSCSEGCGAQCDSNADCEGMISGWRCYDAHPGRLKEKYEKRCQGAQERYYSNADCTCKYWYENSQDEIDREETLVESVDCNQYNQCEAIRFEGCFEESWWDGGKKVDCYTGRFQDWTCSGSLTKDGAKCAVDRESSSCPTSSFANYFALNQYEDVAGIEPKRNFSQVSIINNDVDGTGNSGDANNDGIEDSDFNYSDWGSWPSWVGVRCKADAIAGECGCECIDSEDCVREGDPGVSWCVDDTTEKHWFCRGGWRTPTGSETCGVCELYPKTCGDHWEETGSDCEGNKICTYEKKYEGYCENGSCYSKETDQTRKSCSCVQGECGAECSDGQTRSCGVGGTQTCQSDCTWGPCGGEENQSPTAEAGPDKTVNETETVTLEGSGSDPDGTIDTYSWSCTGGTVSDSNIAQPDYSAPSVTSDTDYTCTLTVTDNDSATDTDSMAVTVADVPAPAAGFSISADPTTIKAPPTGTSETSTITITPKGGFSSKVDLLVPSGLPTGATPNFSVNPITGGSGDSQFTVETDNVSEGTYSLNIQGQSGGGAVSQTIGQAGLNTGLSGPEWQTVSLDSNSGPVVFATTQTTNGGQDPSSAQIKAVSSSGFDNQHCEYDSWSCDSHNPEDNGWLALDPQKVSNTKGMDAGIVDISGNNTKTVTFNKTFANTPLVFTEVLTNNGDLPINSKVISKSTGAVEIELCEQNSRDGCNGAHTTETVAWLAIDPIEADKSDIFDWGTVNTGNSGWQNISFGTGFSSTPVVIVETQTQNGGQEDLISEADRVSSTGAKVRYCEAQGGNWCDTHATETVAWLAVKPGKIETGGGIGGGSVTDSFADETKIASKNNVVVDTDTGQVHLATTPCTPGERCWEGSWSTCGCSYSGTCDESASGTQTRDYKVCAADGTCSESHTESQSCTCTRDTDGTRCWEGDWGSCTNCETSWEDPCDEFKLGRRYRDYKTCSGGSCTNLETESDSCTCEERESWGNCCGEGNCMHCDDKDMPDCVDATYECRFTWGWLGDHPDAEQELWYSIDPDTPYTEQDREAYCDTQTYCYDGLCAGFARVKCDCSTEQYPAGTWIGVCLNGLSCNEYCSRKCGGSATACQGGCLVHPNACCRK